MPAQLSIKNPNLMGLKKLDSGPSMSPMAKRRAMAATGISKLAQESQHKVVRRISGKILLNP